MWKIWRTPTRCSQIVWLTVHRFLFNDNSMDDNETRKLTESADPTRSWKSRFGRLLRIVLAVTLIVSVLLIFLLLVVVVWLHLTHGEVRMSHMLSAAMFNVIDQSKPTIVTWTEFFGLSLLPAFQPTSKCPYDCLFVDRNHLYANQSTVRLFHARDFSVFDLPPFDPNALNVYFSHESPVNSEFRYHLLTESALRRDFFNLTITYQMSSDVFYPYDIFERIDGTENPDNVYTDEDVGRTSN
ncbi:hypothetical protein M3Y95_00294300 [Aphelenchoides besseyi]|nr:hypothetical protein M3Y95_00294300 [Aphelenchoides besseyi]